MVRKRVQFEDFEIPIPKGHEKIVDKDSTTDYLFIHAPKQIYTVYFDSTMPFYDSSILRGFVQASTLEIKLKDRKIVFFCPTGADGRKDGLWYFNIEFANDDEMTPTLPGQILVNYDEVYQRTVCGKLPFIEILENIQLKFSKSREQKGEIL